MATATKAKENNDDKTELNFVEGIGQWAKVFEFNRDKNEDFHGEGGACTIDVLLEKDQLDKLSSSGSRLRPKVTEEGIAIRFKRKFVNPQIPQFGGAPRVVIGDTGDEKPFDPQEMGLIGNGSKVRIWYSVYPTKMGKGTRLEAVQILDLQEYESDFEPGIGLPF